MEDKILIFLLYDSRSGSTLLASLLNRYRGISVSLESAFVSRIIELKNEFNFHDPNKLINYLREEVQFNELEMDYCELSRQLGIHHSSLTKKSIIKTIINCYFSKKNDEARYWIIKHSPYSYLSEVIDIFPEVKFIQIIRDGRAVYNSKKRTISLSGNMMESNILTAAWDWKLKLKKSEKYQKYITNIKYEDLVQYPDNSLEFLLNSLSLNKKERMVVNTQNDYFSTIGEQQKGIHANVSKSPDITIINKWRNELALYEQNFYNFINKAVLLKYGYKVEQINHFKAYQSIIFSLEKLFYTKLINIFKLIKTPSLLLLKVNRRLKLLK